MDVLAVMYVGSYRVSSWKTEASLPNNTSILCAGFCSPWRQHIRAQLLGELLAVLTEAYGILTPAEMFFLLLPIAQRCHVKFCISCQIRPVSVELEAVASSLCGLFECVELNFMGSFWLDSL